MTRYAVGLALAFLAGTPVQAAPEICEATVDERLERLKVDRSDIAWIFYEEVARLGRSNERVERLLVWISLTSCGSYLIIDMYPDCRVRQVYGRGACDLGGAVKTW